MDVTYAAQADVSLPTAVRAAIIRLARAFAGNAAQLDRLINWQTPGTCPPAEPPK